MPTKIFPAYLFLGEEDFLKEEATKELKAISLDKDTRDLNYSVFYGKDKNINFNGMLDNLNTMPFLSKKRMVVLKDADSLSPSFKKSILTYLRNPKETSLFVMESPLPSIKGEFLLEASKHAQLFYYRRLTDSSINTWLLKRANLSGKKMAPGAIKAMRENLSCDLRLLSSNMDSIILYLGKRVLITKEDIDNVMGSNPSHTAFDLTASIVTRDVKKALSIVASLKKDRKKETELVGLLAWNARMLLRVKEFLKIKGRQEIRKDLGLNPRMFDRLVGYAAGLKKSQISVLLDELKKADMDIKTGVSSTLVIERLIVKMCA